MKVLAAMSGGVDSAVAAARAVDAGHDVTGVHLALSPSPASHRDGARGCCSLEDARDARRAADVLDIPFYVWDVAERFAATWSTTSSRSTPPAARRTRACAATSRSSSPPCWTGRSRSASTPSAPGTTPGSSTAGCTARSTRQGPVLRAGRPAPRAARGRDVPARRLAEAEVRAEAADRGLAVADKPDSHDICFIPDGDTWGWLRDRLGEQPGRVVDEAGEVLGSHDGAYGFTVGQRRGLRCRHRPPTAGPATSFGLAGRRGPSRSARPSGSRRRGSCAAPPTWCGAPPAPAADSALAQVRAHGDPVGAGCVAGRRPGRRRRHRAAGCRPGQTLVVYDGDQVLGSATIDEAA